MNAQGISHKLRTGVRGWEKYKKQETDQTGRQICGKITVKIILSVSGCQNIVYDPEKITDQINIHKAWNEGNPPVQVCGKVKMIMVSGDGHSSPVHQIV